MARTAGKGQSPRAVTPGKAPESAQWELRLYIAGRTQRAEVALQNLKKICKENLGSSYKVKVIDLLKNPRLARGDQIVAVPTLVRKLPAPVRRIIGDLSNTERVLIGLNIRAK